MTWKQFPPTRTHPFPTVFRSETWGTRRIRTRHVTNWKNGSMVRRWMASAFLGTEKNFRRIMSYRALWTLEAILSESQFATQQAVA
jgi:hypothetical protein